MLISCSHEEEEEEHTYIPLVQAQEWGGLHRDRREWMPEIVSSSEKLWLVQELILWISVSASGVIEDAVFDPLVSSWI